MGTPTRSTVHCDSGKFITLILAEGIDSSMNFVLLKVSITHNHVWEKDPGRGTSRTTITLVLRSSFSNGRHSLPAAFSTMAARAEE